MAINIFQGAASKTKPVNQASQSSRAQQAKQALAAPAETSASGNTAVKTQGTLSKVGNFIGKAAGVASKFLPGLGGVISKGIANLFNDPEWWQSVPGDALTTNDMLRVLNIGTLKPETLTGNSTGYMWRSAIAEFESYYTEQVSEDKIMTYVMDPDLNSITQYLMPEIRKVVNAIPLQSAESYREVLRVQSTIYALWRQLKKVDYMLKHGTTYLPNMNVSVFPMFQVSNAAWLQSTINRLEEYLRANVRLPHTLCEYLAWRFGRVYKSNASAKAGLVIYDVVSIHATIDSINSKIENLFSKISSSQELQAANTDLYNTYYDHDFMVDIKDDTQFVYDTKEFMLRTNADIGTKTAETRTPFTVKNTIVIDSSLDNPTTFMASTVSTAYELPDGKMGCLFPIAMVDVYTYAFDQEFYMSYTQNSTPMKIGLFEPTFGVSTGWSRIFVSAKNVAESDGKLTAERLAEVVRLLLACKSLDLYNKGIYVPIVQANETMIGWIDLTAISIDAGTVDDAIIQVEQLYAFANLVDIDRKTSLSYAKAEKLVARDTANLIDTMDIAAASSSAK